MSDLVIGFAVVWSFAFAGVWCLFAALSWVEDWLEQRDQRMGSSWLSRRGYR